MAKLQLDNTRDTNKCNSLFMLTIEVIPHAKGYVVNGLSNKIERTVVLIKTLTNNPAWTQIITSQ